MRGPFGATVVALAAMTAVAATFAYASISGSFAMFIAAAALTFWVAHRHALEVRERMRSRARTWVVVGARSVITWLALIIAGFFVQHGVYAWRVDRTLAIGDALGDRLRAFRKHHGRWPANAAEAGISADDLRAGSYPLNVLTAATSHGSGPSIEFEDPSAGFPGASYTQAVAIGDWYVEAWNEDPRLFRSARVSGRDDR